jgi:uncharacterized protein (TIGR03435 family)
LIAAALVFASGAYGQAAPTFDVASIRPSRAEGWQYSIQPTRAGFTARNMPLSFLIMWAYGINDYQLAGAPSWASDRYDVTAKPGARYEEIRVMMQALLADRFKLAVHREDREQTEYALIVAKGGLKLAEPKEASCPAESAATPTPCGRLSWSNRWLGGRRASMKALLYVLSQALKHTVVNETGLEGPYDMSLEWTPEGYEAPADAPPPLTTALQEQMGLKLEARKGRTEVVVVDHVERPTEN